MINVVLKLSARDLVHADLASCGWAGSDHHLTGVAKELERVRIGEVDYLAVCPATDIPVAKGGVDYQVKKGVGTLWQLAVHPHCSRVGSARSLLKPQNCGSGTAVCGRPSLVWRKAIPGHVRYTKGWVMSRTTVSRTRGTCKPLMDHCAATKRCAR